MDISERLSLNRNFINYSYRDEMIADGIENCIIAVHNFDPAKSSKPFSYFTQIIWFAFLRRIAKEKTQAYVKYKSYQNMSDMGELFKGDDAGVKINIDNEFMDEAVKSFEESKKKKDAKAKAKRTKKGLEAFMEDETDAAEKAIDEDTLKELHYSEEDAVEKD